MSPRPRTPGRAHAGQALTEFGLAIPVFALVLAGVFDLGRAVYMYNGVTSAAQDIARVTATNVGSPIGASTATAERIAAQRGLVPGMDDPVFACTDLYGAPVTADGCRSGQYLEVTVTAAFQPVSTLGIVPSIPLRATSSVQIP